MAKVLKQTKTRLITQNITEIIISGANTCWCLSCCFLTRRMTLRWWCCHELVFVKEILQTTNRVEFKGAVHLKTKTVIIYSPSYHSKPVYSIKKSYSFGMIWRWLNDDQFHFGLNYSFYNLDKVKSYKLSPRYMNPRPPLWIIFYFCCKYHHSLSHDLNKTIVFLCPAPVIDLKPPSLTDVLFSTHTRHQRGWENAWHSWGRARARAELWGRTDPPQASHLLLTAGMQLLNVCAFVQTKKQ